MYKVLSKHQSSSSSSSSTQDAISPIEALSTEVALILFGYFDRRSLCRVASVSSRCREIAKLPQLWREYFAQLDPPHFLTSSDNPIALYSAYIESLNHWSDPSRKIERRTLSFKERPDGLSPFAIGGKVHLLTWVLKKGTISVWNAENSKQRWGCRPYLADRLLSVHLFLHDQSYVIATRSPQEVTLWHASKGERLNAITHFASRHALDLQCFDSCLWLICPKGVAGNQHGVEVINLGSRQRFSTQSGHARQIVYAKLFQERKKRYLMSWGEDQVCRIWNVSNGALVRTIQKASKSVGTPKLCSVRGKAALFWAKNANYTIWLEEALSGKAMMKSFHTFWHPLRGIYKSQLTQIGGQPLFLFRGVEDVRTEQRVLERKPGSLLPRLSRKTTLTMQSAVWLYGAHPDDRLIPVYKGMALLRKGRFINDLIVLGDRDHPLIFAAGQFVDKEKKVIKSGISLLRINSEQIKGPLYPKFTSLSIRPVRIGMQAALMVDGFKKIEIWTPGAKKSASKPSSSSSQVRKIQNIRKSASQETVEVGPPKVTRVRRTRCPSLNCRNVTEVAAQLFVVVVCFLRIFAQIDGVRDPMGR